MDRVCFTMPMNTRDFMVAMAVAQDYQLQLALGSEKQFREKNYEVTFRMQERFKYFEPCLRVMKDNIPIFDYSGWDELRRGDFDCFIDFDTERAYEATKLIGNHMTEALGIIIGASPHKYPQLGALNLTRSENTYDVCILLWSNKKAGQFRDFIENNYPQLSIVYANPEETDPEKLMDVNRFSAVIGPVCAYTYAAAALGKALIEIFPDQKQATLYGNFDLPIYQQVIGEQVSAEVMWSAWEQKWPEIEKLTQKEAVNG